MPPPYKPIADTKLLMQAVIDPMADVIWESAGAVITLEGVQELGPKNQEEWTHLRNSAVTLAESGNLLMMSPRAKDDQEWMRLSQAMIDTAVGAIKAAEARNVDAVFNAGGDIYAVCSNCHSKYLPAITRPGSD
jgi:rRNA maturation endonuclease Nob1